jgi:hypothetical protein
MPIDRFTYGSMFKNKYFYQNVNFITELTQHMQNNAEFWLLNTLLHCNWHYEGQEQNTFVLTL